MIDCKYQKGDPTWDSIVLQIMRLAQQKNFPSFTPQAIRELVLAFCNYDSLKEITREIDEYMNYPARDPRDNQPICPQPSDVRAAYWQKREEAKALERSKWDRPNFDPIKDLVPSGQSLEDWKQQMRQDNPLLAQYSRICAEYRDLQREHISLTGDSSLMRWVAPETLQDRLFEVEESLGWIKARRRP